MVLHTIDSSVFRVAATAGLEPVGDACKPAGDGPNPLLDSAAKLLRTWKKFSAMMSSHWIIRKVVMNATSLLVL